MCEHERGRERLKEQEKREREREKEREREIEKRMKEKGLCVWLSCDLSTVHTLYIVRVLLKVIWHICQRRSYLVMGDLCNSLATQH